LQVVKEYCLFCLVFFPLFSLDSIHHFSWKRLRKKRVFTAGDKFFCLFCLFFPLFSLDPIHLCLKKKSWKRRVLIVGSKKVLPNLSFSSVFSVDPIHHFLEKDWGKEESLLQMVKKYCLLRLFFPYFPLTKSIFFSKNIEKKRWMLPKHIFVLPFTDVMSCYAHFGPVILPKMCIAWHEVYNGQHKNLGQGNGQLGKKEACGTFVHPAIGTLCLFTIFPSHIGTSSPRHHLPEHSSPSCERSSP
jgi:hypothetical protein